MLRALAPSLALGLALALAAAAAVPAAAADSGAYYQAELTSPAPDAKVIAGGVLWLCDGTHCSASKGTSRPAVMCKRLAEQTSAVVSFSFGGEALGPDDLKRCDG